MAEEPYGLRRLLADVGASWGRVPQAALEDVRRAPQIGADALRYLWSNLTGSMMGQAPEEVQEGAVGSRGVAVLPRVLGEGLVRFRVRNALGQKPFRGEVQMGTQVPERSMFGPLSAAQAYIPEMTVQRGQSYPLPFASSKGVSPKELENILGAVGQEVGRMGIQNVTAIPADETRARLFRMMASRLQSQGSPVQYQVPPGLFD